MTELPKARPLAELMPLIQADLKKAMDFKKQAEPHYRAVGVLLREAKSQVKRSDWAKWLRKYFRLTAGDAREYIEMAGGTWFWKTDHPHWKVEEPRRTYWPRPTFGAEE